MDVPIMDVRIMDVGSVRLKPDPPDDLTREGAHVMTVCNACRYCEQYCPVFPAMEQRLTFPKADLNYLANLCHNCGECLYACQYAPPHEFGINVPRTLARIRVRSYEEYAWPRPLGAAFRRNNLATGLLLALGLIAVMFAAALMVNPGAVWSPGDAGDFYAVVPHGVMVTLFGAVGLFVVTALSIGVARARTDMNTPSGSSRKPHPDVEADLQVRLDGRERPPLRSRRKALSDVLTLRHLHASGEDCVSAEEVRTPWRRIFHHCTFYGFMLCFASTTVAAIYHTIFGWEAPYGYTSAPVLLGTIGGAGLVVGPAGLFALRRRRDPALTDATNHGLDESFLMLLLLTSVTGLALLVLRHRPVMGMLLIVHLGAVLALFLTLPYGKFVHGLYRSAALGKFRREDAGRSDSR
jgi:citrate/tricarballylate utilization protein